MYVDQFGHVRNGFQHVFFSADVVTLAKVKTIKSWHYMFGPNLVYKRSRYLKNSLVEYLQGMSMVKFFGPMRWTELRTSRETCIIMINRRIYSNTYLKWTDKTQAQSFSFHSQQSLQDCPRNNASVCLVEHLLFPTLASGTLAASISHSSFLQAIDAVML